MNTAVTRNMNISPAAPPSRFFKTWQWKLTRWNLPETSPFIKYLPFSILITRHEGFFNSPQNLKRVAKFFFRTDLTGMGIRTEDCPALDNLYNIGRLVEYGHFPFWSNRDKIITAPTLADYEHPTSGEGHRLVKLGSRPTVRGGSQAQVRYKI